MLPLFKTILVTGASDPCRKRDVPTSSPSFVLNFTRGVRWPPSGIVKFQSHVPSSGDFLFSSAALPLENPVTKAKRKTAFRNRSFIIVGSFTGPRNLHRAAIGRHAKLQ